MVIGGLQWSSAVIRYRHSPARARGLPEARRGGRRVQGRVERAERVDGERALVTSLLLAEFDAHMGEEHVGRLQLGRRLI